MPPPQRHVNLSRRASQFEIEFARQVEVWIEFIRIGEIDTMTEKYQAEICVESKWIEKEKIDKYNPSIHWNPQVTIENAIVLNKEVVQYACEKDEDHFVITEKRNIKGVFWERLELRNFPVDVQELSITITSKLNPSEIKLVHNPRKLSFIDFEASHTFIDQQKWRLFKMVSIYETSSFDRDRDPASLNDAMVLNLKELEHKLSNTLSKHTKIKASCFVERRPGYFMFNAYFLIFLITISAMTLFSVDCKLPQNRLHTTYTLLLTSVTFKWVINRNLPTVSYLTSLDKYSIICIFFICLLCCWHSIVGAFWEKDQADIIDKWFLIGFGVVLLLIHVYFLVWLMNARRNRIKLKKQETEFLKTYKTLHHF